ncbi:hypothetical protein K431DRAFT_288144 [Polychaeton citri CBS 116435]|uniref:GAR domain-containing protein n=1 Tax=Polychaeton citri CBS 116435 TaxID=1314669 RepID=A0A9P4PZQ8_9PEZI|nr:hypothetical protein K431DRAFT_288144 [Polychaeton citri CBS 116435]
MTFPNPTIDPPRLEAPGTRPPHSRSPSRSSVRHYPKDHDALLRDLSPTTTLRAFCSYDEHNGLDAEDALAQAVARATREERAVGERAAQVCLNVRSWANELEDWEWSGSFDVPEPARKTQRMSTMSFATLISDAGDVMPEENSQLYGPLPVQVLDDYEIRLDEIAARLEEARVEELKQYALAAHGQSRYELDDYTAIVTATVLQALPFLAKLVRLMNVWVLRISVLRKVPSFLADLTRARRDLDHGWAALAVTPTTPLMPSADFSRQTMLELKDAVQEQVTSLGKKLDEILDELEGKEEVVPDRWLDNFETLEQAYGDWVVQAERKALETEWRRIVEENPRASQDALRPTTAPELSRSLERTYEKDSEERIGRLPTIDTSVRPTTNHSSGGDILAEQRHTPIIVDLSGDGQDYQTKGITGDPFSLTQTSVSPISSASATPPIPFLHSSLSRNTLGSQASKDQLPSSASNASLPSTSAPEGVLGTRSVSDTASSISQIDVKKRAAFFSRGIEKTESLQLTSKTPVRPFEHASNAFTRLFKNKSPERKSKESPQRARAVSTGRVGRSRSFTRKVMGFQQQNDPDRSLSSRERSKSPKLTRATSPIDALIVEVPPLPIFNGSDIAPTKADSRPATPDRDLSKQLSSPFQSPEEQQFPEDWPLTSPPKRDYYSGSPTGGLQDHRASFGLSSPKQVFESDAFHRAFVESLPGSPEPTDAKDFDNYNDMPGATINPEIPHDFFDLSMEDAEQRDRSASGDSSSLKWHPPAESSTVAGAQANELSDLEYHALSPVDDDDASHYSSDEQVVRTDFADEDFELTHMATAQEAAQLAPSSSRSPSPGISAVFRRLRSEDANVGAPQDGLIRRASVASIGSFSRGEVKTFDVPSRRSSTLASPPHTPFKSLSPSKEPDLGESKMVPASPLSYTDFPRSPSQTSTPVPEKLPHQSEQDSILPSGPAGGVDTSSPAARTPRVRAPLNVAMKKRRPKLPFSNMADGLEEDSGAATRTPKVFRSPKSPTPGTDILNSDSFDRHVSEVLERVQAPIRFRTRAGAKTPELRAGTPDPSRSSVGPRPKAYQGRTYLGGRSGAAGMTIAPAEVSPRKAANADHQPEVKLYHLTQAGRDEPIKLYVRLVGENERVMVRVGGGWADLADYLKQYADHHASRTVSEGALEVKAVDATSSRRISGSVMPKAIVTAATSSPQTVVKDGLIPVQGRPKSTDTSSGGSVSGDENRPPRTPVTSSTPFVPANVNSRSTPTVHGTPKSTHGSRPPTADGARPLSRQSTADSGAGDSRFDLNERKAKWVEGMLEKAKHQSAEKTKNASGDKSFGELGKVGATRRLIFRSSSGVGGGTGGAA